MDDVKIVKVVILSNFYISISLSTFKWIVYFRLYNIFSFEMGFSLYVKKIMGIAP